MATLIEKILRRNTGNKTAKPGDIVTANVDRVMVHDIFIPFVADKFEEMGFSRIWDPDRMVLVYDHMVPASQVDDTRHFRRGDEFAAKYGVKHVHRTDGICHQLMAEQGYVQPGDVVFGTDSHTVTYGALGAFSTGIGYTEMAGILGTGQLWLRVPETIRVNIEGTLPKNVTSKDVILTIIGDITASGATYRSLEFAGSAVNSMSVASRLTMSNMTVEAGAKCGLCYPDRKTLHFTEAHPMSKGIFGDDYKNDFEDIYRTVLTGDVATKAAEDAKQGPHVAGTAGFLNGATGSLCYESDAADTDFYRVLNYRAEDFRPVMACPSQVDAVRPVSEEVGIPVDQVFIGSCTNGRLEDLRAAAAILQGKHVAKYLKLIVTPASRSIYREALADGTLEILSEAGAIITTPGCGLCCGRAGGILSDDEVVVATNNRNFLGRMGTSKVRIYLASPVTAAHCALAGKIALPE
jgi:3-isopropylmalate/(R)-2-methylmalate dehydratase large subunit